MNAQDQSAQRQNALVTASLVRFFGGMLLIAGVIGLLMGAFAFDRDAKARHAMQEAVAVVIAEHELGGAYYVVYEADGAVREALLEYPQGTLRMGDQTAIRYDPGCYEDVRLDAPAPRPLMVLGGSALCAILGAIAMFGQAYLKGRQYSPWQDGNEDE